MDDRLGTDLDAHVGDALSLELGRELHLYPWWETARGEEIDARDPLVARGIALRLFEAALDRLALRALLARLDPGRARPFDDAALAPLLVGELVSGRIRVSAVVTDRLFALDVEEGESAGFLVRTAAPVEDVEEEECIPCREQGAAHQAAILRAASTNGAPFCETR
ncbi:MAG: hypothetical protein U0414_28560 [Polyangiaceae bacterium]